MNIITEFESKIKNIGGEKVYSAREIMKIFGYDKWERFLGAINRAKDELKNEEKINENFFFIVNKETGGRPKEDVLLTLGACYLILKKCDQRKENVKVLLLYLKDILIERKNIKKNSWGKVYIYIFSFVFVLFFVFYIRNYLYFSIDEYKKNNELNIIQKNDFLNQVKKQEENFKKYDEEIKDQKEEQIIVENFEQKLKDYLVNPNKNLSLFDKNFNYRSNFLKNINGVDLIRSFFVLGNNGAFRDSCSLLSKNDCLSTSKSNLKFFGNFWEKTKQGYEIIDLYKVEGDFGNNKNIYCVKYKYKLKYDTSNNYITEIYNYTTSVKNGHEQIEQRFCEKMEKNGKKLKCPFKLDNYYCK